MGKLFDLYGAAIYCFSEIKFRKCSIEVDGVGWVERSETQRTGDHGLLPKMLAYA